MAERMIRNHELVLTNRERLSVSGVIEVESFDEKEVILATEVGTLVVRGQNLHIKQLDLEQGNFSVEGTVGSLTYSAERDGRGRGKSFLDRLLR